MLDAMVLMYVVFELCVANTSASEPFGTVTEIEDSSSNVSSSESVMSSNSNGPFLPLFRMMGVAIFANPLTNLR